MTVSRIALLAVLVAAPAGRAADPKLTAKYEKADVPAAVADPVRKLVAADALVVRDGDGVVLRLWFRTEIPAKATPEQVKNGLTYREIPETAVVGVIEFPQVFTDFRKQRLPAGAYVLRYAVQPDIGDHTGTAPHPDFCLLTPAAADKSADTMDKKDLIEKSAEVNEGRHPAVLLLFPYAGKDDGPKLADKGGGVWVATVRRAVAVDGEKTTLGFGVTVAGVRKE